MYYTNTKMLIMGKRAGEGRYLGNSILSVQYFHKPKTALKKQSVKNRDTSDYIICVLRNKNKWYEDIGVFYKDSN